MRELQASHSLWRDRINYAQLFLQSIRIRKASVFAWANTVVLLFWQSVLNILDTSAETHPLPIEKRVQWGSHWMRLKNQTLAFISLPRGNSAMQKNPIKLDNMFELIANDSVWWRQVKNKPCNKFMASYLGGKAILKHTNQPSETTWRLCQHTVPQ